MNNAQDYVYITTPYLVIDQEMKTALVLAAKNGIDVRILVPHIPDKWYAFLLAKTYYEELINAGVQIYEYTPGFVHAKVFVSDNDTATVGTINLDYRSFYHHFECGTCIYDSKSIEPIYKDFMDIVEKSKLIEKTDLKYNVIKSLFQQILRVFAPLM